MNSIDNVTDQIMQYIREQIMNGSWKVGTKIPSENELCKELGYSRTSLRSALQRYNVLGVLRSEKGRGTFVCSDKISLPGDFTKELQTTVINTNGYLEWRMARNVIEPEIAYRVAKDATPELVQKLRKINREQHKAKADQKRFIQKDVEFHMTLVEFLGNQIMINIMRELFNNKEMMYFGNEQFGFSGGIYFHFLIADAIAKKDASRARNLMYEHGLESKEIVDALKDRYKDEIEDE